MWEIASRKLPWTEIRNQWDIRTAVEEGRRPCIDETTLNHCPPEYAETMRQCWDPEPTKRATFEEVLGALDRINLCVGETEFD